jgi:hypothetical protein
MSKHSHQCCRFSRVCLKYKGETKMADIRIKQLEDQLKRIGCNYRFWGRAEIRELAYVLLPNEQVKHCVNGSYDGGFALIAATDQRVLLVAE